MCHINTKDLVENVDLPSCFFETCLLQLSHIQTQREKVWVIIQTIKEPKVKDFSGRGESMLSYLCKRLHGWGRGVGGLPLSQQ